MAATDKRPYQKPALVKLGKIKIDKRAFEDGELGDKKEEVLGKIREKKDAEPQQPSGSD